MFLVFINIWNFDFGPKQKNKIKLVSIQTFMKFSVLIHAVSEILLIDELANSYPAHYYHIISTLIHITLIYHMTNFFFLSFLLPPLSSPLLSLSLSCSNL